MLVQTGVMLMSEKGQNFKTCLFFYNKMYQYTLYFLSHYVILSCSACLVCMSLNKVCIQLLHLKWCGKSPEINNMSIVGFYISVIILQQTDIMRPSCYAPIFSTPMCHSKLIYTYFVVAVAVFFNKVLKVNTFSPRHSQTHIIHYKYYYYYHS